MSLSNSYVEGPSQWFVFYVWIKWFHASWSVVWMDANLCYRIAHASTIVIVHYISIVGPSAVRIIKAHIPRSLSSLPQFGLHIFSDDPGLATSVTTCMCFFKNTCMYLRCNKLCVYIKYKNVFCSVIFASNIQNHSWKTWLHTLYNSNSFASLFFWKYIYTCMRYKLNLGKLINCIHAFII